MPAPLLNNLSKVTFSNSSPSNSWLQPAAVIVPASIAMGKSLFQVSANLQFPDVSTSNLVIISFFLFTCLSRLSSFGWGWCLLQCLMSVFRSPVPGPRLVLNPFSSCFSVSSLNNVTSSPALHSKKLKLFQFPPSSGAGEILNCLLVCLQNGTSAVLNTFLFLCLHFSAVSLQN